MSGANATRFPRKRPSSTPPFLLRPRTLIWAGASIKVGFPARGKLGGRGARDLNSLTPRPESGFSQHGKANHKEGHYGNFNCCPRRLYAVLSSASALSGRRA